ncbi:caspase-10 isoform X1 [Egretta garzetta]|uniref:caspase-10 isoform X1 n=1 Tax=Egretta garzetta TaxID=188379 RepID=UPI00051EE1DA|nr:caspase-10 isoform X1 [Egretta garzetta]XP_035754942.1 caspase-10 isoform X1 [Egretta garzetta]XP_035754943.1 caspase-10 isoform X1 [Egretta garzetta]XP_035754944.1 caspase-10 isoform X1 [Egretta garzetta]
MEHDVSLKFRQQLLLIDENLVAEDLAALKFLCTDLLPFRKLESAKSAVDIFQLLIAAEYLNEEDTFLVAELLYRMKCHSLLKKLGYTKEKVQECLPKKGRVSPYRQMLYELSENITNEMLKDIIFLLQNHLPKRRIIVSALELLIILEKKGLLTENNVQMLEEVCMNVSPDLLETVNSYKRGKVCLPQQENTLPVKESSVSHTRGIRVFTSPQETSIKSVGSNVKDSKAVNLTQGFAEMNLELPGKFNDVENESKKMTSYKMDRPHRGFCLVINNVKFDRSLQERKGSCKDAGELERVFTWLGLDVRTYTDLTSQEIKNLMQTWQRLQDHKDRDCFICCILSHGESGAIYGKDEELVSIRTIMSHFTAKQCPQLAEKPKLFFIQACQGKEIQCPVYVEADARIPDLSYMQRSVSPSESIPEEADFLLGMATIDGYVSFRHIQQGAWYIQALCSKLQLLVPRGEDILSILTEVNEDVSRRVDRLGTKKQMPQPAYTLRRKFIFPIPRDPPPSQQH